MIQQNDSQDVFNFNVIHRQIIHQFYYCTVVKFKFHSKMTSLTAQSRTLGPSFQQSINACIQDVSVKKNYQRKLMAFFTLVAFSTTLQIFSSSLLYMNPVFQCASQKVFEEEACPQINFCTIKNTGTITAQLNLFCDSRKHERNMLQTAVGIGCWLGIILAAMSDRLGKKFSFCLSLLFLNLTWIFQFAGVYFENVTLLFLSEVISGISNKVIYVAFVVLLTRFLNKDGYELGTLIWYIAFHGLSQVIIAGINATFENWRAVAYVYSIGISLCSIAAFFILKEDPVFLFDVSRIDELKQVVAEIGKQNQAEQLIIQQALFKIDELNQQRELRIQQNLQRKSNFNIKELLRGDIMKAIILIGLSAAFYQMALKSIQLSIQSMESGYNFNLFIVGMANVCGFLTAIYTTKIEPQRKRGLILSSLLYGVIAMLFLFPFCYQNGSVETAVIFVIRFFLCWSCIFNTRLKVDSFPQRYQMTTVSLVQGIAAIGLIIAPSIVQRSVDHSISPIVAVNILRLIIGTFPMFFHQEQHIHLHSEEPSQDADPKQDKIFNNMD